MVPGHIFSQSELSELAEELQQLSSATAASALGPGPFKGTLFLRNAEQGCGDGGGLTKGRKKVGEGEGKIDRGRSEPAGLTFGHQSQEVMTQFSLRKVEGQANGEWVETYRYPDTKRQNITKKRGEEGGMSGR